MSTAWFQQPTRRKLIVAAIALSAGCTANLAAQSTSAQQQPAQHQSGAAVTPHSAALLTPDELQKIIPASVFFRGQSSTVQYRNAGGIRFPGGELLFAVKVDTGGYSTSVQERYQDYFVTEVPVRFGSHVLPAGAYGLGFVGPNLLVLDLGAHTLFTVPITTDAALHRPRPLQLVKGTGPDTYRLYSGKQYAEFTRAPER